MVPVTHQVNTNGGYQGTKAVMTPNTSIVTEAPQMAVLRPNLSDTSPEQKEPKAKPRIIRIDCLKVSKSKERYE